MSDFGAYLKDRNAFVFAGEPLVFHCDQYNCFLQKSIEEMKEHIDVYTILINSAHEIAHAQFTSYFAGQEKLSELDKKKIIEDYYSFCGFGKINLRGITSKGGHLETTRDHYSVNWKKNFGSRNEGETGVSFFTIGFLCGVTEAIYDIPLGTFSGKQTKCLTKGDNTCRFEVFRGHKKNLHESPGEGVYQRFDELTNPSGTSVDYGAVQDSFIAMPFMTHLETGLIGAFGTTFTRHYSNYYSLVSIRILIELQKKFGNTGILRAKSLMVEAAKVGGFYAIGGIMSSSEWESHVGSMVKTDDDYVHGALACINALGWGRWEVENLDSNGDSIFKITGGSESNSYLKMVGKSKEPICYFLQGSTSALMNLSYKGNMKEKPTLNQEFYKTVFKSEGNYEAKEVHSRMMGAEEDKIMVKK